MIVSGFALERNDGTEIQWWDAIPARIDIPSEKIVLFAVKAGWSNDTHRFVAKDKEFPDPEPVRRRVEKWVIVDRLTDEQLDKALSIMTVRQQEKWRMPGYPFVYADDPEVVGLVRAVGADPKVVLA